MSTPIVPKGLGDEEPVFTPEKKKTQSPASPTRKASQAAGPALNAPNPSTPSEVQANVSRPPPTSSGPTDPPDMKALQKALKKAQTAAHKSLNAELKLALREGNAEKIAEALKKGAVPEPSDIKKVRHNFPEGHVIYNLISFRSLNPRERENVETYFFNKVRYGSGEKDNSSIKLLTSIGLNINHIIGYSDNHEFLLIDPLLTKSIRDTDVSEEDLRKLAQRCAIAGLELKNCKMYNDAKNIAEFDGGGLLKRFDLVDKILPPLPPPNPPS